MKNKSLEEIKHRLEISREEIEKAGKERNDREAESFWQGYAEGLSFSLKKITEE